MGMRVISQRSGHDHDGVLDVPVVGVAKSGWGLDQFRAYAEASLKNNGIDPGSPAAVTMLGLLRYVDGDLDDAATYKAMADAVGPANQVLYYWRFRRRSLAASPRVFPAPAARRTRA
jgi:glucose-6-phosphate 1-dehydrogenase